MRQSADSTPSGMPTSTEATIATSVYDYPLSARYDEVDTTVVFDDVFVPREHVFVYKDVELVTAQPGALREHRDVAAVGVDVEVVRIEMADPNGGHRARSQYGFARPRPYRSTSTGSSYGRTAPLPPSGWIADFVPRSSRPSGASSAGPSSSTTCRRGIGACSTRRPVRRLDHGRHQPRLHNKPYRQNAPREDEDWLQEICIGMDPEDGRLIIFGIGEETISAFTDHGVDNLTELVEMYKANPGLLRRYTPPE